MLGIIGAAEDLSVQHEVVGVRRVVQLKIALRWGVADGAIVITAAIRRTYLSAARIVSHAPVMDGAERLKVVACPVGAGLFWGHDVLGHNEILSRNDFAVCKIYGLQYRRTKDLSFEIAAGLI